MKEKPWNWNKAFLEGRLGRCLGGLGSGDPGCVWGLWGHLGELLDSPGTASRKSLGNDFFVSCNLVIVGQTRDCSDHVDHQSHSSSVFSSPMLPTKCRRRLL